MLGGMLGGRTCFSVVIFGLFLFTRGQLSQQSEAVTSNFLPVVINTWGPPFTNATAQGNVECCPVYVACLGRLSKDPYKPIFIHTALLYYPSYTDNNHEQNEAYNFMHYCVRRRKKLCILISCCLVGCLRGGYSEYVWVLFWVGMYCASQVSKFGPVLEIIYIQNDTLLEIGQFLIPCSRNSVNFNSPFLKSLEYRVVKCDIINFQIIFIKPQNPIIR